MRFKALAAYKHMVGVQYSTALNAYIRIQLINMLLADPALLQPETFRINR